MRTHRRLVTVGVTALLVTAACSSGKGSAAPTQSTAEKGDRPTLPTAPQRQRVDLETPSFSHPTEIHNPLFPISDLHSAVLLGNDEGHVLRIETTLLDKPKVVTWKGKRITTLVSQFTAYLDGRIHEVALDSYAQADDGAVWYFGEDVFNYEDGVVADTDGTWITGKDGPPGMIMPAHPQVGDAYRTENIPDVVFEEVVVKSTGLTVAGPRGPVPSAIVGTENHLIEGHYEDKTFAPGYGEFRSGVGGNLEATALAVPTDVLPGPVPSNLESISRLASDIFDAAGVGNWDVAGTALTGLKATWVAHRASVNVPPLLAVQLDRAIAALAGNPLLPAADEHNPEATRQAALQVGQAALDLQLQYRPVAEIDRARLVLWARQLVIDSHSAEPDAGQVAGDVAALRWVRDRVAPTLASGVAADLKAQLDDLRRAVKDEDVTAAARGATRLLDTVAKLG